MVGGGHPYGSMVHPRGDQPVRAVRLHLPRRARSARSTRSVGSTTSSSRGSMPSCRRRSTSSEQGNWDLFIDVVAEAHCVGHQLWHVHDVDHPRHDPAVRRVLGDPIVEVYKRLDAVVGEPLRRGAGRGQVYVHLSHGMSVALRRRPPAGRGASTDRPRRPLPWQHRLADHRGERGSATCTSVDAGSHPGVGGRGDLVVASRVATAVFRRSRVPSAERRWFRILNNTVVGAMRVQRHRTRAERTRTT